MAGPDEWWNTVPGLEDLPPEFEEPYPEGNFPEEEWSQRHNPNIHRPNRLPPQDEVLNPELRSMDSQMLADLMAQQATQPEQGYFGGMGEAIQGLTNRVAGMSGMERAALISALVAAGLITMGSGGMLAPAGAALVGGAGMAALNQ
jgi:hypothetical protein